MSQYPLFPLPVERLAPDQRALLERIDAALSRMEAAGEHLREDWVLPDGRRLGYHNLKSKRDRIAAGEPFDVRPATLAQAALIAGVGASIRKGVGTLGGGAVYRDDPKKWDPVAHAAKFLESLPDHLRPGREP